MLYNNINLSSYYVTPINKYKKRGEQSIKGNAKKENKTNKKNNNNR